MAINCKIELNGYLGAEPKVHNSKGKTFVVLRVATTDSYPQADNQTGEIKWKSKETLWHDVLVFRAQAAHFARELQKGDAVNISGTLAYRTLKDEQGHNVRCASIVANFVEKIDYARQDELFESDLQETLNAVV